MSETVLLSLNDLPRYQKRNFVPEDANLADVKIVIGLYEQLYLRTVRSSKELEGFILDRSELDAAVNQHGSILYIYMTCQTDDPKRAADYKLFIETIVPAIKPLDDRLNHKFLKELEVHGLDEKRYEVYIRDVKCNIELFVDDNVPLQTQIDVLSQEYQTVSGAMTVLFEGKERTLPEMSKYLLEPDRAMREKAWRATAERRLQDCQKLEEIFDKMRDLRNTVAKNAGFSNFRDYQFKAYHRFDYTPEDCKKYHRVMENYMVPLLKEIAQVRSKQMGLKDLRPWDIAVDPFNRSPLKPFGSVNELISKTATVFQNTDPELGEQFKEMKEFGLLDLASRKGKAPGGYQSTLSESRKPFIFMNAVGLERDVRTLLHEGGHAFHALACAEDPLVEYRHAPMEFSEVASMAMELLAGEHISVFYSPDDAKRSTREHLEDILKVLVWVANIDAFQHWMYENPKHTAQERKDMWVTLYKRFGGDATNWQGLQGVRDYLWHRQLHIFEVPFYYIEYGIAQLGALQLWRQAKEDPKRALTNYRNGLKLGGSRPLPELYKAAGIEFDFSERTIAPLVQLVKAEWERLV
jgi:oligoendopeptidase F